MYKKNKRYSQNKKAAPENWSGFQKRA